MKKQTVYIIQYNDCYGNGDQKSIEGVITSKSGFTQWLKEHNANRKADGNSKEGKDEFDLIECDLLDYSKNK